jgi:hypothetical protein
MTPLILTPPNSPEPIFTVMLEGQAYDFRMQWNNRDQSWYLGITTRQNTNTFTTKMRNGVNIIKPYKAYLTVPNGYLGVYDTLKTYGRLERDSFSSGRFLLFYITSTDMEAAEDSIMENLDFSGIERADLSGKFTKE